MIAPHEVDWKDNKEGTASEGSYRYQYLWIIQKDDDKKFSGWYQGLNVGKFDTLELTKAALIISVDEILSKKAVKYNNEANFIKIT